MRRSRADGCLCHGFGRGTAALGCSSVLRSESSCSPACADGSFFSTSFESAMAASLLYFLGGTAGSDFPTLHERALYVNGRRGGERCFCGVGVAGLEQDRRRGPRLHPHSW